MKKKLKFENLRIVLTALLFILFSVSGFSQACPGNEVTLTIRNVVQTPTTLEYDVYMMNTGTNTKKLVQYGGNIRFPASMLTTGELTVVTQPSATGNFPGISNLAPALIIETTYQARWTNTPPAGEATAVPLPPNVDLKFARFRITNTGIPWVTDYSTQIYFSTGGPPLGVGVNTVNVYCNGNANSTALTIANGSLVLVNPTISDTCFDSGTYTHVAASCSTESDATATITMSPIPTNLSASYILDSGTPVLVTLSASGVFTILGLSSGTHTLSVTGSGSCSATPVSIPLTITANPTDTPTFTQVAPICAGATLAALPTVSNNGINGTWAPALDNMNTTTYTFTPSAGECAAIATMTITVNPSVTTTTTVTACSQYTWAANGTTYTASGIYTIPVVLQSGIFNTLATWTATATANGATVSSNPLTGMTVAATAINTTIGGVAVNMTSTLGGMYAAPTFVGTNNANQPLTMTFNPPVYGVSGNYYITNSADAVIAGTLTVTYSDGTIDTQPVTANTDFFGYFKGSLISSVVITPVITTPAVNRFASMRNLNVAVAPACQTKTLDLTITPTTTVPTFTQVAPICAGGSLTALPTTSDNAITGTWAPALDNMNTTTYTFTPAVGECATTATMTITVNPSADVLSTVAACDTYTWPVNGTTYTASGIYTIPYVLQSGIFNTLATWTATATANGATVSSNPLTGMTVAATAINTTIGGVAVNMTSTLGGMYAAPTFVGTNNANQPLTMTFNPPVYGVSGNYYITNSADAVIAGTLTVTYSDGTIDTQPVTANTDFFGYFKGSLISSVVITPVITTPAVNRFASMRNLNVAVAPACQTRTLDLTITPTVTTAFTQIAPICAGSPLALPTTSNNGITGTWAPALDNMNTTTYTFTPAVGQCGTTATMTITVNPSVTTTTTATACGSYTWAENGTTYTASGIYTIPYVLQSGIFNTLATWTATATANGATVSSNPLTGMTVAATAINTTIGGVAVNMTSTLGGMYAAPTFVGTNNANQPLTMTFNPPVYGVSGNYYITNSADAVIAGTLTVTYSDGTIDTQPVTANTDFFGYFKGSSISSVVITPVITTPAVNRFASIRNLNVAVAPCQTKTLDLTITPEALPTFTQVAPICAGSTLAALPTTSDNAITGTWAPALDNMNTTTYTFTPAVGECATTATMTITVTPVTNTTSTVTACDTYTWAANGTTYTTSGIYVMPVVLSNGIFNTLPTWTTNATNTSSTVSLNPMSGLVTTAGAVNTTIGGIATTISAPGTMYAAPSFVGTNLPNETLTMTFASPVYGVSGNFYVTNINDVAIAGTLTVTYSDGTVNTQPVSADTAFFGYFKDTGITSIAITPTVTVPNVNRYVSIKNVRVAVAPACATQTLDLTINTTVTPTFTQVAPICAGTTLAALPTTSNNGVTGTWAPALDNMNTTTYTFTPTAGQCVTAAAVTMTITVTPAANTTSTVTACDTYTWAANGTTYTTSGIYVMPVVLSSGIFNTLPTWTTNATNTSSTVSLNPMSGLVTTAGAVNTTIGGIATTITAPGTMYAAPSFVGTNLPNETLTMTFASPVYGVSGNFYVTNINDVAIAGTLTVTYSDGTVNTQPVSADTAFFGYFKDTGITSIAITPTVTVPNVNRYVSIKNVRVAVAPACATQTLDLTINPAPAMPTGNPTQSFSVAALSDATIASLVVSPPTSIWYGSEADALGGINPLPSTTVLTNGATYWAVNVSGTCSSAPFAVTVTVTLGNNDFESLNFDYYPNPTSSVLNISYSKVITEIQVTNMLGQVIMTKKTNEMDVQVDLSRLAEATYFVKVTSDDKSKIVKIMKRN